MAEYMKPLLTDPTTVYAQNIRGQTWIHFDGLTFVYESRETLAIKKTESARLPGNLPAPMPGKITKIFKNAGDSVKKGEAVLVMEAMKMEYTLKADGEGKIEKINCQLGEQVNLGKILVQIKETK
jgi:biotin carboxyl carrier protein